MIAIFLPLVALGFATSQVTGLLAFFPFASLVLWCAGTLAFFLYALPRFGGLISDRDPGRIAPLQLRFNWLIVAWVLVLHAGAHPAWLLSPTLARALPQSLPMFFSTVAYLGLWWGCSRFLYQKFRMYLATEQTPADFFRARLTLPILFFPPMAVWMLVEDLIPSNTMPAGLADVWELALAPIFFVGLYLVSPYLFNWAWSASPLPESGLSAQIHGLARFAQTPISGVKVWNTFHEPLPNAAVAGLSSRYRFVYLTDYLMHCFSPPEILAVVAHELGHFRLGHVATYLLFTIVLALGTIAAKLLLFLHYPDLAQSGWFFDSIVDLGLFLVAFLLVFTALARASERQADRFAASLVGGDLFANTLMQLKDFLVNPDRRLPWWLETHPDFQERIAGARAFKGTAEQMIRQARGYRAALAVVGLCVAITLVEPVNAMLAFSQASEALQQGQRQTVGKTLTALEHRWGNHPGVLELKGKYAVLQGRWFFALTAAAGLSWGGREHAVPRSEILHHAITPEVTLYFDFVQFLLKSLDLGRVHGVPLFDEVFNLFETVLGHEGILMDLRHDK